MIREKNIHRAMLFPPFAYLVRFFLDYFTHPYEKIIFVATTGRSGSNTLTEIFNVIPGVQAKHEPHPILNGREMIEKNEGNPQRIKYLYRYSKEQMIRLGQIKRKHIYVETNHMFIKSFIDEAYRDFRDKMSVIHLYRNAASVAKSLYELQTIPGTVKGNHWYLDYRARSNLIQASKLLDSKFFQHDFYKCLWYWYEIEARTAYWKKRLPDIDFYDLSLAELNDTQKMQSFFIKLGIVSEKKELEVSKDKIGKAHNQKKRPDRLTIPQKEVETMFLRFKKALEQEGWLYQHDQPDHIPLFNETAFNTKYLDHW